MADELSPADEARLRRLLARSRHDEQVPDDVASRLDDVLARLESGDPELVGPRALNAQVRELAARRRRTVTTMLVAAAAVAVVGIGLGQVLGGPGGDSAAENLSAADAVEETADRSEGRTDADAAGGGEALMQQFSAEPESDMAADALGSAEVALEDLLVVRGRLAAVPEERFTRAAARLQRQVLPRPRAARRDPTSQPLATAPARVQRAWQGCAPTTWGEGTPVAVLYAGDPAVLVFRTPTGDAQVVELLQCGTGEVLRSVTLPAG